jgi:hypothetical protein
MSRFRWGLVVMISVSTTFGSIDPGDAGTVAPSTASVTIPFVKASTGPLTSLPQIRVGLDNSSPIVFTMDTGSTGLVVGTGTKAFTPSGPSLGPGEITYSSSGIILTGNFYQATVKIGSDENYATAFVPVLLVDQLDCTPHARHCTPKSDPDTAQFGVGFGRENGGNSDRTPSYNAFLNIIDINGTPVTSSSPTTEGTLTSGYIITPQNVTLGLTKHNTRHFRFLDLTWSQTYGDWEPAPGTLTINGSQGSGTVLNDSGVSNMYAQPVTGSDIPSTAPYGVCLDGPCLKPGTQVKIAIGNPGASTVARYRFTIGSDGGPAADSSAAAPEYVTLVAEAPTAFINTTYHFFNEFAYVYDYTNGKVGYRKVHRPFVVSEDTPGGEESDHRH